MQPVEHLPAAASDTVELVGPAPAPPAGRCDGASGVFATLGLQLERVRAAQPRGARVEVWFQDEARIGQKNSLTRVWGQTGSRPAAPKDLGFASAYVFGAVCPLEGKAAALIMPICNTAAMNHHLCEISSQVAADAHAVVILDGASWHNSRGLVVPSNITLLALPPYSPELNPVERVWHYLRSHWLANPVFRSLVDIMDACETAWNRFAGDHDLIRSALRGPHARDSAASIPMISLAFLTTWGQSGASGCRTINHWQLGARKPYGARLFGVFALVQIGFKFPFGERRIGEFGRKARDAPDRPAGAICQQFTHAHA